MIKRILLLSVFFILYKVAFTQRYGRPANQSVNSTYVSPNYDAIIKEGRELQARWDNIKDYREKLINWITDIKSKTDDKLLIQSLNVNIEHLNEITQYDLNKSEIILNQVRKDVENEIIIANRRVEERPKLLLEKASQNLENKNYQEALKYYYELEMITPENSSIYSNIGYCHYMLGNSNNSIKYYNKYLNLYPNDITALSYRGWAKYYEKDYYGCISDFNKWIELDNLSNLPYYSRGCAKIELSDYNGALIDLKKSFEINSNFYPTSTYMGYAFYKLNKFNDALSSLNKAIQIAPDDNFSYSIRSEVYFSMSNFKNCLNDCNRLLEQNPNNANALFYRGRVFYKQSNKKNACSEWKKASDIGHDEATQFLLKYCKN